MERVEVEDIDIADASRGTHLYRIDTTVIGTSPLGKNELLVVGVKSVVLKRPPNGWGGFRGGS